MKTRFKVSNELVNVVGPDEEYSFYKTGKGKLVHIVPVGSNQHRQLLAKYILELEERQLEMPTEEVAKELEQKKTEMDFMIRYCASLKEESIDGYSTDEAFGIEEEAPSEISEEKLMHVTAATFGELTK